MAVILEYNKVVVMTGTSFSKFSLFSSKYLIAFTARGIDTKEINEYNLVYPNNTPAESLDKLELQIMITPSLRAFFPKL